MKLYFSPTSPFARKCRIVAQVKSITLEEEAVGSFNFQGYVTDTNPLGKIPVLLREDGVPLFDSPVICEYLDSLSNPWLPSSGEPRWEQLRYHRLGDGLAEAVYNYRFETLRDEALRWEPIIARHESAIKTTIAALEGEVDKLSADWDFGTVSLIVALDYTDFRAGHLEWRSFAPKLAAWHEGFKSDPDWKTTYAY